MSASKRATRLSHAQGIAIIKSLCSGNYLSSEKLQFTKEITFEVFVQTLVDTNVVPELNRSLVTLDKVKRLFWQEKKSSKQVTLGLPHVAQPTLKGRHAPVRILTVTNIIQ